MRAKAGLLVVIAGYLLGGCAYSLHPVAPDKGHAFDPSLLGTWKSTEPGVDDVPVTVISPDRDSYEVLVPEKGQTMTEVYTLQLFRLGGALFYDWAFSRVELSGEKISTGDLSVLPLHSFGRIWIHPDAVRIGNLNREWLAKALSEKKVPLSYEDYEKYDILLTAPSEKVRAFAQQYADDKDAFSNTLEFRKQN